MPPTSLLSFCAAFNPPAAAIGHSLMASATPAASIYQTIDPRLTQTTLLAQPTLSMVIWDFLMIHACIFYFFSWSQLDSPPPQKLLLCGGILLVVSNCYCLLKYWCTLFDCLFEAGSGSHGVSSETWTEWMWCAHQSINIYFLLLFWNLLFCHHFSSYIYHSCHTLDLD